MYGEFVKPEDFTPSFQHNDIQDTFLTGTSISSHAKILSTSLALGTNDPKTSTVQLLNTSYVLKSLPSVFLSTPKPRLQTYLLVLQMEKLHVSDGRQTVRSRLTILLLQQDLVHADLLQSLQLMSMILSPSW